MSSTIHRTNSSKGSTNGSKKDISANGDKSYIMSNGDRNESREMNVLSNLRNNTISSLNKSQSKDFIKKNINDFSNATNAIKNMKDAITTPPRSNYRNSSSKSKRDAYCIQTAT